MRPPRKPRTWICADGTGARVPHAKIEDCRRIELSGKETLFRFVEADRVAEILFEKLLLSAAVAEKVCVPRNGLDRERLALAVLDRIALAESELAEEERCCERIRASGRLP